MTMEPTIENIEAIAARIANKEITLESAVKETGWHLFKDVDTWEACYLVPNPDRIYVEDGTYEDDYDGMTPEDAVQLLSQRDLVDQGNSTYLRNVRVWSYRMGINQYGEYDRWAEEPHTIFIAATDPKCSEDTHDWQRPLSIVGEGVNRHEDFVCTIEVCMHCGCRKETHSCTKKLSAGEQGRTIIAYYPRYYANEVKATRTHTKLIEHDIHLGSYDLPYTDAIVELTDGTRVYITQGFSRETFMGLGEYRWDHGVAVQVQKDDTIKGLRTSDIIEKLRTYDYTTHTTITSPYFTMIVGNDATRPVMKWDGHKIESIARAVNLTS